MWCRGNDRERSDESDNLLLAVLFLRDGGLMMYNDNVVGLFWSRGYSVFVLLLLLLLPSYLLRPV